MRAILNNEVKATLIQELVYLLSRPLIQVRKMKTPINQQIDLPL